MDIPKIRVCALRKLLQHADLVLYGAGAFAQSFYEQLAKVSIPVAYCVVSKIDGNNLRMPIPVYEYSDMIQELQKNKVVLIAVSEHYEKEIENILKNMPLIKYGYANAFIRDCVPKFEEFHNKNEDDYIIKICEWYADAFHADMDMAKKAILSEIEYPVYDQRKIDFVVADFSPRVVKISKSLKQAGYHVNIFFTPQAYIRSVCMNELMNMGIPFTHCNYIEELMYCIIHSRANICHVFSKPERSEIVQILLEQKKLFPVIVYDEYDVISGLHLRKKIEDYRAERYCMEHADAICNRGHEYDYLVQQVGFKISGKWLQFSDYCRDDSTIISPMKNIADPLSICYVGLVRPEIFNCGEYCQSFMHLAELCERNQCHMHIYPTYVDDNQYELFIKKSNENEYFHFHRPVDYGNLFAEISQYDYGFLPMSQGFENVEDHGCVNKYHFIYGTTNKLYDYLDAGLPIISAYPAKAVSILAKENVVFTWVNEEIDFQLMRDMRNIMKQNAMKAREKFRMKNNISRLTEFYCSIGNLT